MFFTFLNIKRSSWNFVRKFFFFFFETAHEGNDSQRLGAAHQFDEAGPSTDCHLGFGFPLCYVPGTRFILMLYVGIS